MHLANMETILELVSYITSYEEDPIIRQCYVYVKFSSSLFDVFLILTKHCSFYKPYLYFLQKNKPKRDVMFHMTKGHQSQSTNVTKGNEIVLNDWEVPSKTYR